MRLHTEVFCPICGAPKRAGVSCEECRRLKRYQRRREIARDVKRAEGGAK